MHPHRAFILFSAFSVVSGLGPAQYPITSLVSFGDSYTDRLFSLVSLGQTWTLIASSLGGFTSIDVAVSGATCNSSQVSSLGPVMQAQIPLYLVESLGGLGVSIPSTVFSIWIGGNDVGSNGLLGGNQAPGITIDDVTRCSTIAWVNAMYNLGARNFLFQNMIPFQLTPMYKNQAAMANLVQSGNSLSHGYLSNLALTLSNAHIGLFDSYALFSDMYNHPEQYLNGTDPLNVDSSISQSNVPLGPRRASYLWWDALHPSEQADRIVAREIVKAVNGQGSYTTWFS